MENKIELHLGGGYSLDVLKEAFVTGLAYEYMADKLVQVVRKYSDVDLQGIDGELATILDEGRNITFAKLTQWTQHKRSCYQDILALIPRLDEIVSNAGYVILGELAELIKGDLIEYLLDLTRVEIAFDSINLNDLKVKEEIVNHVIEEVSIIDQTEVLIGFSAGNLKVQPLVVENFRNVVVEKKIAKLNKIVTTVKSTLTKDFNKLHSELMSMYSTFYKISDSEMLDGEKDSKARHIVKILNNHKGLLDKLQDKMSNANELKRQLVLNRNKLQESFTSQIENYDRRASEGLDAKDIIDNEKISLEYVTNSYVNQINSLITETNLIDEDIAKKFDIVDKLIVTLKTAIPSESEMKRFSNIAYKFQELAIKLDMTKVQMQQKNKDIVAGINTASTGFRLLVKEVMDGKELFIKNSLMSAMFNSVNIIYDLVDREDKLKEIDDIKMVTNNLARYSIISNDFQKGLIEFRKIAREGLASIAIMMGKEYDGKGLMEIIGQVNETLVGVQDCLGKLKVSNAEQVELLKEVLFVYKNEE